MTPLKQRKPFPITRRDRVIEDYHGTKVADPYRWLEDDTCPDVQNWINEQNTDFEEYISQYEIREDFKNRLTELWNYEKALLPYPVEDTYYTWRNNGLQNQNVLYRSKDPKQMGELVLDPNLLSTDGTIAVTTTSFSPNGKYLAYGLSKSGSDWQTLNVLNLETLETLSDVLQHLRFTTPTWLADESGFIYSRFPDPNVATVLEAQAKNNMVCLHILGQDQEQDKIIHKDDANPEWNFSVHADEDNKWLFMSVWYGTLPVNQLFYKPMAKLDSPWLTIADNFDEGWNVIGVANDIAYVETQQYAPFGKLMSVKLSETGISDWKTIIPDMGELIENSTIINNKIITTPLSHATHRIKVYELDGTFSKEIELPAPGSIAGISSKQSGTEMFFGFASFLFPGTIFRYDFTTDKLETIFAPKIDFPFHDYITEQVFYESKDGTKVPMFITRKKHLVKHGNHRTLLYGYGGFTVNMTPSFAPTILAWLEKDGIYAQPCLRGGNEYGEAWHRAGMLESKQNVFDDFIAAAEYLIAEKYTCPAKISINGGSNGGLLTGACLTQRPDLFGAVAVAVPVLDMLRYHRFTIGRYWIGEYGCAENPEQFPFMYKYSPLHNVKMNAVYPPTIILTADTDDRVVPSQARKFAATLQAADGGENPLLIRIEKSAGHGAGKPVSKIIQERADLYTFLYMNTMDEGPERKPTDELVDFTQYPIPTLDPASLGHNIKKTMHLLTSSTAEKPNKVRIAYTGQSIVDPNNTWPADLTAWLRETYPTAEIVTHNFAIGGFATEFLRKRMPNDIASFYPDLVICYVSGNDEQYEEMVRYIKENTMAEMMIHTSHISIDSAGYDWAEEMSYKRLPAIAQKYGAQMCDTRTPWKDFLVKYSLDASVMVYDNAHLNVSGQTFMLGLMKQFFVLQPSNVAAEIQAQYIPITAESWKENKLTVPFTGNRVEVVYGKGECHPVTVLVDGKKPSDMKEAYIRTEENDSMWTKMGIINFKKAPGLQKFTITIDSFTDPANFTYTAVGSVTGLEGTSNAQGVLDGNYLHLTPDSFIFHPATDNPKPGEKYTFETLLNGTDTHPDTNELFDPMMLISGIPVGEHILTLEAEGGRPNIVALKIYNPQI